MGFCAAKASRGARCLIDRVVGAVNKVVGVQKLVERGAARRPKWSPLIHKFEQSWRRVAVYDRTEQLVLVGKQGTELGFANARSVFQDRLKDRLHVPWRRADNFEDFCRCDFPL